MIDDRTERLINRKLDGELTDAESLELDKLIIRSPEARALLEACERTDALAAEAIDTAFAGRSTSAAQITGWKAAGTPRTRHVIRALAGMTGVAAAVLLGALIGGIPAGWLKPPPRQPEPPPIDRPVPNHLVVLDNAYLQDPITGPRQEDQYLERDIFGVFDQKSRSVYFLELNHGRATVTPVFVNY